MEGNGREGNGGEGARPTWASPGAGGRSRGRLARLRPRGGSRCPPMLTWPAGRVLLCAETGQRPKQSVVNVQRRQAQLVSTTQEEDDGEEDDDDGGDDGDDDGDEDGILMRRPSSIT
jgi:hypothetical protein